MEDYVIWPYYCPFCGAKMDKEKDDGILYLQARNQKEKTVNEITPEMIEAADQSEKRIKERVDRIYDELIAEKRAEIERLKAEIAKMPPLDYDKLAENPPEYPVCVGYKCWDGKEADNDNKNL